MKVQIDEELDTELLTVVYETPERFQTESINGEWEESVGCQELASSKGIMEPIILLERDEEEEGNVILAPVKQLRQNREKEKVVVGAMRELRDIEKETVMNQVPQETEEKLDSDEEFKD